MKYKMMLGIALLGLLILPLVGTKVYGQPLKQLSYTEMLATVGGECQNCKARCQCEPVSCGLTGRTIVTCNITNSCQLESGGSDKCKDCTFTNGHCKTTKQYPLPMCLGTSNTSYDGDTGKCSLSGENQYCS